jgi:S1-C subfamily serine protease
MKRVFGFGLVLLTTTAPFALAAGPSSNPQTAVAAFFMMSGPASSRTAQGYLGVSVRDVTPDQLSSLKLREARGAEIILVDHDAPAGKAGLREHDVVLTLNGQPIVSKDQLRSMLHDSPPGKTMVLLISRDGQQMTITTQMAVSQEQVEREASEQHLKVTDPSPAIADSPDPAPTSSGSPVRGNSFIGSLLMNPSYTGAMLEKMSTQLADFFGVPSGAGLLVRSVIDNSPAALAGMHAGDVVIRADAKPVTSTGDWAKAIKASHGHPLSITVMRDKKEQTLTLTPDSKKRSSLDPDPDQQVPVAVAHLGFSFLP